jgi:maleate isomerase
LTPHVTAGPEIEIPAMSSGRVSAVVSRILVPGPGADAGSSRAPSSLHELRQSTRPSAVDAAAAAFSTGSFDAFAFASTSAAYAIGFDAELALVRRLRQRWKRPVASSSLAVVSALRAFAMEKVTVVHPPWFDDQTNDLGAVYFRSQGFQAVALRADDLPDDPAEMKPGPIVDWVSRHLTDDTEAVFLGGNGLHAATAIEPLERRTGRLVVEANQVLLWSILAATGTTPHLEGYGRLLGEGPPAPQAGHL